MKLSRLRMSTEEVSPSLGKVPSWTALTTNALNIAEAQRHRPVMVGAMVVKGWLQLGEGWGRR